mmetsp:Transcript_13891/g.33517  ORF Transcript_13891/g.33517 Transcript_13891/m.33517 type:complete len:270 (+) Transcript_13891:6002-6811(+)
MEIVQAAPFLLRGGILEEVVDEHVLELQALGLEHRAHQAGAQVQRQALLGRLLAHDDALLRAELDLRIAAVGAQQQHLQILVGRGIEQPGGGPRKQTAVGLQVVDGVREELAQHVDKQVGHVENAGVRAEVVHQLVDLLRLLGDQRAIAVHAPELLVLQVFEDGGDVLEPEGQAAGDGLRGVAGEEQAVGVFHRAAQQQQLAAGEVLHLVHVGLVDGRRVRLQAVGVLQHALVDVRGEVAAVVRLHLALHLFVLLPQAVNQRPRLGEVG